VDEAEDGDFPLTSDATAETWGQALGRLDRVHEEFLKAINRLPETALDQAVVGKLYSISVHARGRRPPPCLSLPPDRALEEGL